MSAIRNPNLGPSQMRMRRRRLFFIRLFIILFFLLVITLGLAIFSGSEKITVQTIIVSGNAAVSSDDVLAITNRDMTGRYFYLFSRRNSLIFPRSKIKADLLSEIKTIKSVNIDLDGWQQISIILEERKPHSVWCGENMNALNNKCLLVDNTGYVYGEAPDFAGDIFIRNYGKYMPDYPRIYALISNLRENGIRVTAVFFDGIDYKFVLESGPEIIFSNQNNLEQVFGNFFSAIENGHLDMSKGIETIKYIDLRFDNKVVVGKK